MKKTKLLTSIAALALVVSLGACEVNVDVGGVDVGDVDVGVDVNPNDSSEPDEGGTSDSDSEPSGDEGSNPGEDPNPGTGEPTVTYTYSVEVTNADALKELTYDGNADSQTGVDLTINLVTTSSTGDVTTNTASESDVTLAPASEGVVTVSGLTVTPVAAGDTTLTVTWTERNASTTADVSVTDVTVSTPEPTPTEPTTWTEYLEANADGNHIDYKTTIDTFLDGDLDEIVPYVASEIGYQYILVYEAEGRVAFKVSDNNSGPATNAATAWKAAITNFGYTDLGGSAYQNEAGYKVEFEDWSFIGDFTVYVYPIEQVQEGPTSWADYITNEYDLGVIAGAFGDVSLDEILPFSYELLTNSSYSFQSYYVSAESFRLMYSWPSDSTGLYNAWDALLTEFGYTLVSTEGSGPVTYTYTLEGGYTVKIITSTWGDWDLYLYPPEDTGDEGGDDLETAQAILNAAAAQTNGYQDFECVNVQARYSNGGGGAYQHSVFDLTNDSNNNVFGREMYHDEAGNDERANFRYYYEKNYYRINNSSGANAHYDGASYTNNSVNSLLSNRLGTHDYDVAFDNASSIVLADATDFELTTEANGNYKLTFIYNNTWYCYKADTNLNLVGAGHAINWSDNYSYEIYYGEEESVDAFNAIMDEFFADEYWFPTVASDDEIAQEILDAADDCDTYGLDWDAFHGEYINESTDETDTLYLTTDSDGLYGSGICLDDGDPSFEYYYKNGKEYIHNSNYSSYSVNDSDFYYGDSYDDIIEAFTEEAIGNAFFVDLDDDSWTLNKTEDGYELIVESTDMVGYQPASTEYVYITDLDYNLLAVAYGYTASSVFEGWYAEQATADQVEASLEGFDLTNWGEGDGGDEATPSWADYMTETAYNTATSTLGKTLDEVLPVVLPDGANYAQISASATRIQLDASYWDYGQCPYDYETLNAAWNEALIADGWSCTFMIEGKTDSVYNTTYATYTKDGYQVEIQFYELYEGAGMWGWDLNLTVIK